MPEPAVIGFRLDLHEFITVQVDEGDRTISQLLFEPGLAQNQFRVALMSGAFRDNNALGAEPQKTIRGSSYELRVRIHRFSRQVFDQIGFQQNRLAAHVQLKPLQGGEEDPKLVRILGGRQNRYS